MKHFFISLLFFATLFAQETDELESFRTNIADYYYRFLDFSTSFLYKKSNYDYIKKHNKLRLYLDNRFDQDGKYKGSVSIRANIKLPKISKNLYFTVDKDSSNQKDTQKQSSLQEEKQRSRVGLKYYFLREKDQSVYAKLGGRINFKGSKFYLKLGADKENKFENITTFVYFNEYYYFIDKIFKTEFGVDFRKRLNKKFILSQLNNITLDQHSQTYISNTLLLDQYLNKKSMLSYWTTVSTLYDNKKFETTSVSFNIKYHYLLKKWIFVDFIPSVIKNLTEEKRTEKYFYVNFGFIF